VLLEVVWCNGPTQLHHLNISNLPVLRELECWGIATAGLIETLDLTGDIALHSIDCNHNKLTQLDLPGCSTLEELNCDYNNLSSLDVLKNQALSTLYCSQNEITSVDISNNFLMWRFKCDHNKLTNLDVTKNPGLQTLSCGANLLTSLDISHNAALKNSYPLTSLFINDMPTLNKVCVWETTFPPVDMSIDATGSPNVIFSTDCSN
jgi:Leucine-rich repeat (LRR) protein